MATEQTNTDNVYSAEDIEQNKTMAGLAYFIFFLPLIVCPESGYAKFHANQGLLLFLLALLGNIVLIIIPFIGWVLLPFFNIGILVLAILGLINGIDGKAKHLPIIGKLFVILK